MAYSPLNVIFEDNHLLVVDKPPGIPTQGAEVGRVSLVSQAREYLKQKYNKPGNVYVGVVSRLDSMVSGVIVFAKTSKGAERLNSQFRERTVEKVYWAIVEKGPQKSDFALHDWIRPAEHRKGVEIARPHSAEAVEARLSGVVVRQGSGLSVLQIELQTGRKHQIRVQLASRGWPILGDSLYGSARPFPRGIALHSKRLCFLHPTLKTSLEFESPLGVAWRTILDQIGGV